MTGEPAEGRAPVQKPSADGNLYETTAPPLAPQPALDGSSRADVAIVGAGLTGLGAALTLARAGRHVIVVERGRVGAGASGINGGQIHPGQRRDQRWLEEKVGQTRARALWDYAAEARRWLFEVIEQEAIACAPQRGLITLAHRPALFRDLAADAEHLARHYGASHLTVVEQADLPRYTGAEGYHGAVFDAEGGHLDPLALTRGLAAAALAAGARIAEDTPATALARTDAGWRVATPRGDIHAASLIVTGDGNNGRLVPVVADHVMPLVNFMIATEPLGPLADAVLAGPYAGADTRFVVNYFRRTADGRLVFGGGESYGARLPPNFADRVRRRMLPIFPMLESARITHGWGGVLGITAPRLPFVRQIEPGLHVASGYSGQGVMLAPFTGRAMAEAILGDDRRLSVMTDLPVPKLPGGRLLRRPLLIAAMLGFGLLDRL